MRNETITETSNLEHVRGLIAHADRGGVLRRNRPERSESGPASARYYVRQRFPDGIVAYPVVITETLGV